MLIETRLASVGRPSPHGMHLVFEVANAVLIMGFLCPSRTWPAGAAPPKSCRTSSAQTISLFDLLFGCKCGANLEKILINIAELKKDNLENQSQLNALHGALVNHGTGNEFEIKRDFESTGNGRDNSKDNNNSKNDNAPMNSVNDTMLISRARRNQEPVPEKISMTPRRNDSENMHGNDPVN